MKERNYGEITTFETRKESYDQVDKQKRYAQIKEILSEWGELTAKQIAVIMFKKGYIPTSERNYSSPRLTELCISGEVEVVGKTKCEFSGKTVSVFKLREE
jgi:hypothetical protein